MKEKSLAAFVISLCAGHQGEAVQLSRIIGTRLGATPPRVLWVGIGCIRGTSQALIHHAITEVCQQFQLAQAAIAGLATIEIKEDELGLLAYCEAYKYPLKTFTSEALKQVKVPNPSQIVAQEVGTASVAEAAALLAAKPDNNYLLVRKQIFKSEDGKEAVTIAIAESKQEYLEN